jgi:hypothetical protein
MGVVDRVRPEIGLSRRESVSVSIPITVYATFGSRPARLVLAKPVILILSFSGLDAE